MNVPSAGTIGRAVVMTAISLTIINFVKGYLPQSVRNVVGI